jgi:hypothetical protein
MVSKFFALPSHLSLRFRESPALPGPVIFLPNILEHMGMPVSQKLKPKTKT